jgi:hypothetical protein
MFIQLPSILSKKSLCLNMEGDKKQSLSSEKFPRPGDLSEGIRTPQKQQAEHDISDPRP